MGAESEQFAALSLDHFREWRRENNVFDGMAVYGNASFNLTGSSEPRRIEGQTVSPSLFPLLGVSPIVGRMFTEEEGIPGRDKIVIFSFQTWQRLFGSDPGLVGRSVQLDGESYITVGVMPPEFRFPDPETEFWVPMAMEEREPSRPGEMRIELVPVIARLKPGVTVQQAEAAAEIFLDNLKETSDMERRMSDGVSIHLTSMHEQLVRPIRPALLVLLAAVGCVLLIACANVANLFLVRAQGRETEIAVRAALGAGRRRLISKLLTESVAYGLAGGLAGLVVAYWGVRLARALKPADVPLLDTMALDMNVLLFTIGVSLLTAILVGVVPAIRTSQVDLVKSLKGLGGSGGGGMLQIRPGRLRYLLAVVEIALALVLLVGAGLLLRSFLAIVSVDPGYQPRDTLSFRLNLPETKYPDLDTRRAFFDRLKESMEGLPGVEAAGLVNLPPLVNARAITVLNIEGQPPVTDRSQLPRADIRIASADFFRAMGIPLLRGRAFLRGDGPGAPPVAIINEALARRYFPDEEALGQRVQGLGEIVGVVGDVRQEGLEAEPRPEIYLTYRQTSPRMGPAVSGMTVVLRHDPGARALVDAVKARLADIDPELPLANVTSLSDRLSETVARPRLYAVLLVLFAGLALVLAVSGVYSVVSYSVSQRMRETGVRMALGASSSDILRMVLIEGLKLTLFGIGCGVTFSVLANRLLESVLFEVTPLDPVTFVVVTLAIATAVLIAVSIPARQAARTNAMSALRYE